MKIGIYVSVISGQKGFENNVSGHIQVPLRSIEELQQAGHEVHLITNKIEEGRSLPFCLDESNMDIHYVTDARERGGVLERTGKQTGGMSFFRLRKQVQEIKAICKEQKLDVLHLFGYNRTAHLAGGLCLFGLKIPVVITMFGAIFPERLSFLTKRLWNRIDAVVTATEFVNGIKEQIIDKYNKPHQGSDVEAKNWIKRLKVADKKNHDTNIRNNTDIKPRQPLG